MNIFIGLDVAERMGVATWNPQLNKAYVHVAKGSPIHQLDYIFKEVLVEPEPLVEEPKFIFVIERLHNFQNKNTVRSLLERTGFIKYSLISAGFRVEEVSPLMARAYLGVSTKENLRVKLEQYFTGIRMTDDHSDALAVALYQASLEGYQLDFRKLTIQEMRT